MAWPAPEDIPDSELLSKLQVHPRRRVLLVDVEPYVRRLFQVILSRCNYDVDACPTPEEAFELLEARPHEVVALDLWFWYAEVRSAYTGFETLDVLRARWPGVRAIVLTMRADPGTLTETVRHGAFCRVCKDDDPAELVYAIERAVASS